MSYESFLAIYERLSRMGVCDRPGGYEYQRVRKEWIDAGEPDEEWFIRRRADIGQPGARRREQPAIFSGDVVEHTNSGRSGIVLEIGRVHCDGSTELRIRLLPPHYDEDPAFYKTCWNSQRVERARGRDPYRRYLSLCVVEDDPGKQTRRAEHPNLKVRRYGGWLNGLVWDQMFWRLKNRKKLLPSGEHVHYSLGREHWDRAALDCLERRDRSWLYWNRQSCLKQGA